MLVFGLSFPGYYPNINDKQIEAVKKVLQLVKDEGLNFNTDDEYEFLKALRFLRARKFDVDKAMEMIRADIIWRSDSNRSTLRRQSAYEVLQCDLALFYKYFPAWIQGYDRQDRPIYWRGFNFLKFETWNILKITTMERLINFYAWELEMVQRKMIDKSKETGHNIETFTVIVDAAGWHLGLATRDAYTFIKAMADTDGNHYPERLEQLVVINATTMQSLAWSWKRARLDDVQKSKIRIFGSNPEEWRPVLFSIIDPSQVPVQYGGTMPDLPPELALSSMDPPAGGDTYHDDESTVAPRQILCGTPSTRKGYIL